MKKFIYIGMDFYWQSGTAMSPLYEVCGERSDWGKVELTLQSGEEVKIRPATEDEMVIARAMLREYHGAST